MVEYFVAVEKIVPELGDGLAFQGVEAWRYWRDFHLPRRPRPDHVMYCGISEHNLLPYRLHAEPVEA